MEREALDAPGIWRAILIAMATWAVHFAALYASALIFQGGATVMLLNAFSTLVALGALIRQWQAWQSKRPALVRLALGIAGVGILFDAAATLLA